MTLYSTIAIVECNAILPSHVDKTYRERFRSDIRWKVILTSYDANPSLEKAGAQSRPGNEVSEAETKHFNEP